MAKKNKTAADIYREEMSEVTQPKDAVEVSRPLDNIKITPEDNESIVPTDGGAFDPSKWGISTDTDNMGGTIKTNRATASIVDNDEPKEKPEDNDPLKFLTDMTNLWTKEDEEAAAKKKKAAQWITAAQMLGDSIAALSNVYWTGKGANAQKFEPGAQKAAAATYQLEQDIRNAREKAAKAQYNAILKKYEMEMQREREKKADERYASEQAEGKRRYDEGMAYRRERDKISDAQQNELLEFRKQQESRLAKSATGGTSSKSGKVNTSNAEKFTVADGETVTIEDFDTDKLYDLYNSLPQEIRDSVETSKDQYGNTVRQEPTPNEMMHAIMRNKRNPEVANVIRKMAGVKIGESDQFGDGSGRGSAAAKSNVQTGKSDALESFSTRN